MFEQNISGRSTWNSDCTSLANTTMVPKVAFYVNSSANNITKEHSLSSIQIVNSSQSAQNSPTDCLSRIRQNFRDKGFSEQSIQIMCSSWRNSTIKQYKSYYQKWLYFCNERSINPLLYNEIAVLDFLTFLFNNNASYSAVNISRCALSTLLVNDKGVSIGNSPLVKRFMKGVFELRPPKARYDVIWDVNVVLAFLKNFFPEWEFPLDVITYKAIMLLALSTKQRAQTLHAISVNNLVCHSNSIIINVSKLLKHSSRRNYKTQLYLTQYPDPSLCVVRTLKHYLERTSSLRRGQSQLFISFLKPHNPVSKETISRWIKRTMFEAGIDTNLFKAHSTDPASTSAAKRDNVPIDQILASAGWSSCNTFDRFYNKVIVQGSNCVTVLNYGF